MKWKLILIINVMSLLLVGCSDTVEEITSGNVNTAESNLEVITEDIIDEIPKYKSLIGPLDFGMHYDEVIKLLGKPNEVINVVEENLILLKGYFMVLVYDNLELVMYNSNYESKFDINRSTIIQIDIKEANENNYNIKVGDSIEQIKKQYDLKPYKINSEEAAIIYKVLIENYHKENPVDVYFLHGGLIGEMPVAIAIYVDKNHIITRVVFGLPTAG